MVSEDKEYVGILKLHGDIESEKVYQAAKTFTGAIYQTPPLKAAVKKRLRKRTVHSFDILERDGRCLLFRTKVEAGTYIRKLCFDLGEFLGVGASMVELRRIRNGPFNEDECVQLGDLTHAFNQLKRGSDEYLYSTLSPVEKILPDLPKVIVRSSATSSLYRGAPLMAPGVVAVHRETKPGVHVTVYSQAGELVEIATATVSAMEMLEMREGIVAKPLRVLDPIPHA